MMPKIMCSQRSTIISFTCAPAGKEKCGCHRGKAAKRLCGSMRYLAGHVLSSRNTVADFVRKGQPGPQGTNRGKPATMACWLVLTSSGNAFFGSGHWPCDGCHGLACRESLPSEAAREDSEGEVCRPRGREPGRLGSRETLGSRPWPGIGKGGQQRTVGRAAQGSGLLLIRRPP